MNPGTIAEISHAIWASRYSGLDVATLFNLLDCQPATRADLGRQLPERDPRHIFSVAKRLLERRVLVVVVAQGKSRRRRIAVNPAYGEWRGSDGTLTFATGSHADNALTVRLKRLRAVTSAAAEIDRVGALTPKTDIKGRPYGDEPGQRHLVDPTGALDETEKPPWDEMTERLKATRRRE